MTRPRPEPDQQARELEPVLGRLQALEQQNALLRDLVSIYARLSSLVLQGAGLDALTALFAEMVRRDVYVLDPGRHLLTSRGSDRQDASVRWPVATASLEAVLATVAEERRPVRVPGLPEWGLGSSCVLAPIGVGDEILGYLSIVDPVGDPSEELDLLTVEHAATVYALALMRQRIVAETANQLRGDLVEGLLSGQVSDPREARERALLIGYDPQLTYRVMVLALEGLAEATGQASEDAPAALGLRRHVLQVLADSVVMDVPRAIGVPRQGELIVFVPATGSVPGEDSPRALAGRLQRQLDHRFPLVMATVGIGGPADTAVELARSYAQARQALQSGRLFQGQGTVVDFEELGVYRLLFETASPGALRSYVEDVLGPLMEYDRRHQADLVQTLRAYFTHNGSLQAAARDLYVHVNTVAYRMQRIEQISGRNLSDADDRLAAQLALKIVDGLSPL